MMMGAWLVVAPMMATPASASTPTPTFRAFGSAEQVYVTGLPPSAPMSLVTSAGQTPPRKAPMRSVDCCSGTCRQDGVPGAPRLQRDGVGPAHGALRQVGPLGPGHLQPIDPDSGYTYLTTRDGTQLAIDVHPPTSPAGEPGCPRARPSPKGPTTSRPIPL